MEDSNAVVLNFTTGQLDILSLSKMPKEADAYEYITETLNYNLSNCEWMVVGELKPNFIND